MTITLQKIENKYKREGDPGDKKSVAGMVRIGGDPIPFETDGPKKERAEQREQKRMGKLFVVSKQIDVLVWQQAMRRVYFGDAKTQWVTRCKQYGRPKFYCSEWERESRSPVRSGWISFLD
jgi:hypothetical protein